MPWACAIRVTSFTGTSVPSMFDMWVIATILVRGADQLLEFVDEEMALVVDRRPFDHRALALAQKMPGHDVGVVLHDRENDLVAFLDALAAERIGDEIDRLGGVAGEDDLFLAARH